MSDVEQWLIGDGEKIYVCDFFVGSIYADIFINGDSWISENEKLGFCIKYPKFKNFGERFCHENTAWLDRRVKATGKYNF